ncbi:hypothetical protein PVAND_017285 [Polypedilum vanderplanki]|uniref:Uncharacterized protein n=1 Tax=Polypedilum vanderplanki TaxID=319348 RepID=A0A9J6BJ03_POLVA|nr:hypothetical protein PVAND_017285 [Polypedilum vanderplanki]
MKCLFIFLLIFYFTNAQRLANDEDRKDCKCLIRFRAVQCKSYNESLAKIKFCYVKAYSRTITTLNIGTELMGSTNSLFVRMVSFYRYGTIYREIMDTKWIDWCAIMKGADYNLFLKLALDGIKKSVPGMFHPCPYGGLIEYYNITLDLKVTSSVTIS